MKTKKKKEKKAKKKKEKRKKAKKEKKPAETADGDSSDSSVVSCEVIVGNRIPLKGPYCHCPFILDSTRKSKLFSAY